MTLAKGTSLLRLLVGLVEILIGAAAVLASYALVRPRAVGLSGPPSALSHLPFDLGFWALALLLFGTAMVLHALPPPPWAAHRRTKAAL